MAKRVLQQGRSVTGVARESGVSCPTVYKWVHRYRVAGEAGLGARASRPHPVPLAAAEFRAMLQAATLSAGTAATRPKESHGAVPG